MSLLAGLPLPQSLRGVAVPALLLVAVWVIFGFLDPGFADGDSAFAVLQGFAFLGLITLAIGTTMLAGELDLSVSSVAAVAGIVAVKLLPVGLVPSVAIVVAGCALLGAVQGYCIAWLRINSLVFTIGTMLALRGLAYVISGERSVHVAISSLGISNEIIQRTWEYFSPYSLVTIAAFVLVGAFLAWTRWGREVYAIGGGRQESAGAGVPQRRPIVVVFTISATMAGLGGALSSISSGSGAPFSFEAVLLAAVTAALIGGVSLLGGRGNIVNMAIGALILQTFTAGLSDQGTPTDVQQLAVAGLLLTVILIEFAASRRPSRRGGRPAPAWLSRLGRAAAGQGGG